MTTGTVAFTSPFVPPEWVAAHGLRPVRLTPDGGDAGGPAPPEGLCPFAASALAEAARRPGLAALVLTSTCDQMRRAPDVPGAPELPLFILHVPSAWRSPHARPFYRAEIERLGRFLVAVGGRPASCGALLERMEERALLRRSLLSRRSTAGAEEWARQAAAVSETGALPAGPAAGPVRPEGRPVLLLGGPMTRRDWRLLRMLEEAGASVAADGTEQGERTWPAEFDAGAARADPVGALADAYFGIPDVFRRPNDALYAWVEDALRSSRAAGIVLLTHRWCDLWRAEAGYLKERCGVPVLQLELGSPEAAGVAAGTRLQAFLEMLS